MELKAILLFGLSWIIHRYTLNYLSVVIAFMPNGVNALINKNAILPIHMLFENAGIGQEEIGYVIQSSSDDDLSEILTQRNKKNNTLEGHDGRPTNSSESSIEYIAELLKKKEIMDTLSNDRIDIFTRIRILEEYLKNISGSSIVGPNFTKGGLFTEWDFDI